MKNMSNNNQTNRLIKRVTIIGDFILLNAVILIFSYWHWFMSLWGSGRLEIFILGSNIALIIAQLRFSPIIHLRMVGAGDIMKRIVGLVATQIGVAYFLLKVLPYKFHVAGPLLEIGTVFFVLLVLKRLCERLFVKQYRESGRNTRAVTLVGSDTQLLTLYDKLRTDPTLGYHILGYYGKEGLGHTENTENTEKISNLKSQISNLKSQILKLNAQSLKPERLGSMEDFIKGMDHPESLVLGDELYLCVSRMEEKLMRRVSNLCDHQMVRFYYIPISAELLRLNLKREALDDMDVYTAYENPLQNPLNKAEKRAFDLFLALVFLIPTLLLFPIVWVIMKIQSPGPLFFKQKRTGMDGKEFYCYKFRSMHVNKEADTLQATKNDPRTYPFGSFMRKANLDEVPQIINVIKGDMSVVGPRPHMLAHTEQYSQLIDKYMVRHYVKPGVTGWAQVTGYRGETNELWQMEGRVKRDIWYMEHWSIWLDIRIIWLTLKTFFVHDKNAY